MNILIFLPPVLKMKKKTEHQKGVRKKDIQTTNCTTEGSNEGLKITSVQTLSNKYSQSIPNSKPLRHVLLAKEV